MLHEEQILKESVPLPVVGKTVALVDDFLFVTVGVCDCVPAPGNIHPRLLMCHNSPAK